MFDVCSAMIDGVIRFNKKKNATRDVHGRGKARATLTCSGARQKQRESRGSCYIFH